MQDQIIKILEDNKAYDIKIIDVSKQEGYIYNNIIIANGLSGIHINTLKDKVLTLLKENNVEEYFIEGTNTGNWILIDTIDTVIHLFREPVREYYKIDNLFKV